VTAGASSSNLVSKWLNMLRGTAFTAPSSLNVQLHTGDPGAAGTANQSAVTTRQVATVSASASGSALALSNTPACAMTATETISHISIWDASTSGNFLLSIALTVAQAVNSGDTLNLNSLSIGMTPQAA
jgi:hypothetical protein